MILSIVLVGFTVKLPTGKTKLRETLYLIRGGKWGYKMFYVNTEK